MIPEDIDDADQIFHEFYDFAQETMTADQVLREINKTKFRLKIIKLRNKSYKEFKKYVLKWLFEFNNNKLNIGLKMKEDYLTARFVKEFNAQWLRNKEFRDRLKDYFDQDVIDFRKKKEEVYESLRAVFDDADIGYENMDMMSLSEDVYEI